MGPALRRPRLLDAPMTVSTSSWLREQARPVRSLLASGVAAGVMQALLVCVGAWLVAHALAQAVLGGQGLAQLWPGVAALLPLVLCRFGLSLWQRRATFDAGAQVSDNVRDALEQRLRQLGAQWAARQSSGDVVTRCVDGVQALIPYYAGYLPQVALTAAIPAVILLAVLPADPWSTLILLLTAPLIPLFMVLVGGAARAGQPTALVAAASPGHPIHGCAVRADYIAAVSRRAAGAGIAGRQW